MRLRFACVLAVAACSSGNGAYVTVHLNGTDATSVALYIGQKQCVTSQGSACTAIDPIAAPGPGSTTTRVDPLPFGGGAAAGAWFQSDNVADGLAQSVPANARDVVFHIEAGDDPTPVQLIAIGSDANGPVSSALVYDLTIPAGSAKPVDVAMTLVASQPAAAHEADPAHPDGRFVDVWDANTTLDPIACVLVEDWANNTPTRSFIVPPQDADCDGFATYEQDMTTKNPAECRELWFDYQEPASNLELGDTACATTTVTNTSVCVAGAFPCIDGMGRTSTKCSEESAQVCIPGNNCADPACALPQSTTSFDQCSRGGGSAFSAVVVCVITTDDAGGPCAPTQVAGMGTTPTHDHVDLRALFPQGATATCKDLWVTQADSLISPQPGNPEIDVHPAEFDLTFNNQTGPCDFDIDWKNSDPIMLPLAPAVQMLGLDLSNNKTLLLPLELVHQSCPQTGTIDHALGCSVAFGVAGTDPVTACTL